MFALRGCLLLLTCSIYIEVVKFNTTKEIIIRTCIQNKKKRFDLCIYIFQLVEVLFNTWLHFCIIFVLIMPVQYKKLMVTNKNHYLAKKWGGYQSPK